MHLRHARTFALTLLFTAFTAVGCVRDAGPDEEVDEYRQALPSKEVLQIKLPGAMEPQSQPYQGEGVGTSQQALVGQKAQFYLVTRDISNDVNAAVYYWLSIIEDISSLPPTNIVNGKAFWGPHTEALSLITHLFVMTGDGQGNYDYALLGKVKNQPDETYVPIVEGSATPGPPGIGHGTMRLNFDNRHQLDPSLPEDGMIEFVYASVGLYWTLDVHFSNFVGDYDAEPVNALYHYRENADESGDFGFLAHDDVDDNGSALEVWHMRSRWLPGGSGRGDAVIVGGDLGPLQVYASECWDAMFARTYWHVDPEAIEPPEGDPASCVFPSPAFPY